MATETVFTPETGAAIEARGIERVPPAERTHVRILDNFTMWLSANLVISTVALGTLAISVFQLGFWDGVAAIILFNILGVLPVAFFATLGPKLGLRQMTISRFSFGWIGGIVMALFNVAACIGWSAFNVVVGSQLVSALSHNAVPPWLSIIVIALLTTLVSVYGYKYVHHYERYAWMPMALIFAVLAASSAHGFHAVPTPAWHVAQVASFVSFGGAIYGFATGWSSYAADYNVNQPEDTPAPRIFWLTFFGVTIPCILLEIFGLALTTVGAFHAHTAGEFLAAAAGPLGPLGTIILGLLALSIVANNIPNDYSLGLTMQVLGLAFQRVNRAVWTVIGAVIYVLIAIPAVKGYNEKLENFLLLIAYWLAPWSIILVLEHFVFRKGRYNVEDWDTRSRLPVGWAAMASMAFGVFGVYLGAAQLLFVGPVAKHFNPPYGMDIGFELGMAFAGLAYVILRPLEIKGRQMSA